MFAVIYLPDFRLQAALRLEPEWRSKAVAVVDGPRGEIFELSEAARNAGVSPGMSATQAMARCPQIAIKARSLARENAADDVLLQAAYCFSPSIEATAPGVCTLDLKGLRHSSEAAFGDRMIQSLARFDLRAQVGVAENPLLAWHAARQAKPLLAVADARQFLSELSIDCIDPSPAIRAVLKKWGIRTLGAFTALGKNAVAERLGPEATDLFERAIARATRPLRLVNPPEHFEEAVDFENEIEVLEPLLFILRRFLEQIIQRLELAYWVAGELQLRLGLTDGSCYERLFTIPAPTGNVETLFRMLHTHLENLRTDYPIRSLRLGAKPCRAAAHQFALFETALRDPNQFHETLARLAALLGPDRAGIAVVESTHRPDAFQMAPVPFKSDAKPAVRPAPSGLEPFGLTLRRFRPPIAVEVRLEGERPAFLQCTQFKGRIIEAQGPWCSSGDWWDPQAWQRQEWDIQTAPGALYRIYQEARGWFLDGTYD